MLKPQQIGTSAGDAAITLQPRNMTPTDVVQAQPRTRGALHLSAKRRGADSVIDGLRQSGAYKVLFPRGRGMLQAIVINTSGGVTGGDRLVLEAEVGAGAALGLTTQAAERAYRSRDGVAGSVSTRISVGSGASLHWLPQELILYDGCALDRRLEIDLAPDARLLMVEPVLFGRAAMGERLVSGAFNDRISVTRDNRPLYCDAVNLAGAISAQLAQAPIASGACGMVSLLYVAPEAEHHLPHVRAALPETGGASLLAPDVLALRLLAEDGFALRRHLLPILDRLSNDTLPVSWRL